MNVNKPCSLGCEGKLKHHVFCKWWIGKRSRGMRSAERREMHSALVERDGPKCHYCGVADGPSLDHVIPRSLGGRNVIDNFVLACTKCNGRKANKVLTRL